jgi:hypothetical protein
MGVEKEAIVKRVIALVNGKKKKLVKNLWTIKIFEKILA